MAERQTASAEDSNSPNDRSGVGNAVSLDESGLDESSGLAISRRKGDHFWTHNDSGGKSTLYAFDVRGRKTGQVRLTSVKMIDWEDMASYTHEGVPRLLVADCGDNSAKRSSITLHFLDEPDPTVSSSQTPDQTLIVVYPDGPRDCEAIAVDPHRNRVVMVAKSAFPLAGVYQVPLPQRKSRPSREPVTATRVATLTVPMITATDIDQVNGDLWIVSYFQAFRFRCLDRDLPIARQLARLPEPRELPRWKQIESIAVDQSHGVWVTSEGSPTPMGRLAEPERPDSF